MSLLLLCHAMAAAAAQAAGGGGSYPAGVVAKGLQAVWDLETTAGRTQPTTKTVGVDALPAGASWDGVGVTFSGTNVTLQNWDLSPAKVLAFNSTSGTVLVEQCELNLAVNDTGYPCIPVAFGSTSSCNITLRRNNMNFAGDPGGSWESPIYVGGGGGNYSAGTLTLDSNKMYGSNRDYMSVLNGNTVVVGNHIGKTGVLAPTHFEFFHYHGTTGNHSVSGNHFDTTGWNAGDPATNLVWTSYLFTESGAVTITVDGNIFRGAGETGGYGSGKYGMQCSGGSTWHFTNNVVAGNGVSSHFLQMGGAIETLTGNVDLVAATPCTVSGS